MDHDDVLEHTPKSCSVCGGPIVGLDYATYVGDPPGWIHGHCIGGVRFGFKPEPVDDRPARPAEAKDPWRLLPMEAMHDVLGVLLLGATKYGPEDWRTRPDIFNESWEAAMRHLQRIRLGEVLDAESGLHHAAHLVCRGLFMLAAYHAKGSTNED
mgnify:CR=1 FL=1